MNKQKSRVLLYGIFPLLAAVIGAGLVYYGYRSNSDLRPIDNIYNALLFKSNFFTGAIVGFLTFAEVIALSAAVAFNKHPVPPSKSDTATVFSRTSTGLFFLGTVAMQFLLDPTGPPYLLEGMAGNFQKISLILAVLSALYFLIPVFYSKISEKTLAFCGLAVVFWLTLQLVVQHYFMLEFLASPNRLFPILSMAILLFFMIEQLRRSRGRSAYSNWYIATGLMAFILTFSEAVPRIILSFTEEAGMQVNLASFYALVRLALGIYAFVSAVNAMLTTASVTEEVVTEAVEELQEAYKYEEYEEATETEVLEEALASEETAPTEGGTDTEDPTGSIEETTPTEQE